MTITDQKGITDFVYCHNCTKYMIVKLGAHQCPICNEYGTMAWVNQDLQEVITREHYKKIKSDFEMERKANYILLKKREKPN